MTAETPAALLRRAAEKLREHAGYLELGSIRGPWSVHSGPEGYPQEVSNVGVPILICNTFTDPKAPPVVANWIALMHPGVGRDLADLLEQTAGVLESSGAPGGEPVLRLARRILGEEN